MKTVVTMVENGPGFTGSLVATLQTKEQVLGKQIIARQLTNHGHITMLLRRDKVHGF